MSTDLERIEQVDRLLAQPQGAASFVNSLVGWLGVNDEKASEADLQALSAYLNRWVTEDLPFHEFYDGSVDVATIDGGTMTQQVGVLGTSGYLAAHTKLPTPSFITRGVFVVERLLCAELPDDLPDAAFAGEGFTEREVFDIHSKQPCATCHNVFDRYGAPFQGFTGETSAFDPNYKPLGETFSLFDIGDVGGSVSSLEEMAQNMGASDRAPACMAQLFYRHAMRRSLRGGDSGVVGRVVGEWVQGDMSLRSLLVAIVAAEEFSLLYP